MEKPAADCASRLPSMKNRIRIAKVTVVVLALICVIMVIFILAKSSQYFGKLFSLSDEITAKAYLKEHFQGNCIEIQPTCVCFTCLFSGL
jgi:hypothetical protein